MSTVNVTNVFFNQIGPVSSEGITGSFPTFGGSIQIFVSGSGWTTSTAGQIIGVTISIDGNSNAGWYCQVCQNNPNAHAAFVPVVMPVALSAGSHIITLTPYGGTTIDVNDVVNVTVIEII